jgi:hypothetical protein
MLQAYSGSNARLENAPRLSASLSAAVGALSVMMV